MIEERWFLLKYVNREIRYNSDPSTTYMPFKSLMKWPVIVFLINIFTSILLLMYSVKKAYILWYKNHNIIYLRYDDAIFKLDEAVALD